ncbi:hypothetical protein JGI3_00878 [Candidatus Kryptobacter tengchongensis]|nr:hypothetical protein [Candidatus Kryptobacter tengchongensis]CUS84097.1 hypothetical protein JGI20_00881 [Candidatus Kryptobacter tengchongensis]CUU04033.1 hypothetical protein JGI3_00878 [Candidatus Kryptobacter tengchongensis]
MKCNEVKNNLVDYATGKLESEEIAKHLEVCESCRIELEQIKEVVSILSEYEVEEPTEFYWSNFLSRVKRKIVEREKNVKLLALKPVFVAPSIAVIIIGFLLGIGLSDLFVSRDEIYFSQVPNFEMTGVLIKPSDFDDLNSETIEQAIFYLYDKYQIPNLDEVNYDYRNIDIDEVLKRISNKF